MHEFAPSQVKQLTLSSTHFDIVASPGGPSAWQPWMRWPIFELYCGSMTRSPTVWPPPTSGDIQRLGGDMVAILPWCLPCGTVEVGVSSLLDQLRGEPASIIWITHEPASGWRFSHWKRR